ncbi:CpsD/CapB family tyrosine-protein kinase [Fuscibacter oryzae]|uniref:CpsD/CapB family tyrosine-protein kinase n=1 Tax=Fuscibacter oryzae TaxID=2803939 RepID=A0A8J7SW13_9RHOB|nr:CpsD/CapB family tyrosine-protein kinase [Fuscibacter oryzae]MBL4930092.1 CpsD/CapB family tyrosine-protein kinase [Fuscibacter oryzae]
MERLQAAIEKARAQREGAALTPQAATAPAATAPSAPISVETSDLWHSLRPLDMEGLRRQSRQLVTLQPGAPSAPFDILRTRITQQAQANGWKRIAITSPHSGCGKTMTTANLAFSFGRHAEQRTLVIDFDMRRGTLAKTLGQTPAHNMGDVLEGRVSFADHALRHGDNVAFGLNGSSVKNPSELLQSTLTRDALTAIEAAWQPDLVLFDVPPLRATDDSIGFLRQVDAAIIIVAAEETPMNQIDVAERQVAELTNVMGIVLNKCRIMDGDYGYESYDA